MMKIEHTYSNTLLRHHIMDLLKTESNIREHGCTSELSNSDTFLDIEFDKVNKNIVTIKWVDYVDNSFHNDDYMNINDIDYKIIKTKKINLQEESQNDEE